MCYTIIKGYYSINARKIMNFERYLLSNLLIRLFRNNNGKVNRTPIGAADNYFAMIISGRARFTGAFGSLELFPGELLYIPKGYPYTSEWFGDGECVFYSVAFNFSSAMENSRFSLSKIEKPDVSDEISALFPKMNELPPDSLECLSLFYMLYSFAKKQFPPRSKAAKYPEIERIISLIESSPDKELSNPDLARKCGMSEAKFYYAFKSVTGVTPVEYKNVVRSRLAVEMLSSTDKTVEEIADELNFSSPAYLRRLLKKKLGKTPKDIRASKQNI